MTLDRTELCPFGCRCQEAADEIERQSGRCPVESSRRAPRAPSCSKRPDSGHVQKMNAGSAPKLALGPT